MVVAYRAIAAMVTGYWLIVWDVEHERVGCAAIWAYGCWEIVDKGYDEVRHATHVAKLS